MKSLSYLLLAFLLVFSACKQETGDAAADADGSKPSDKAAEMAADAQADATDTLPTTTVEFAAPHADLGTVKEGEPVEHRYEFTNTGENPLQIYNVKPSCGCTTPEYSTDKIAPGEKGFILAKFDSKGRPGINKKSVIVSMNTEQKHHKLSFDVEVEAAAGDVAE